MARSGGAAALAVAACAGSGGHGAKDPGEDPAIEPVDLVGETDQGLRLRIDVVAPGEVRLRFPAVCGRDDGPGDGAVVSLHRHPFVVPIDRDGGIAVDESYVEDGTDGDEEHVDVRIDGAIVPDGTASGTLEVTSRWWNGQSEAFGADCVTGVVHWSADGPPVEGDNLVVPLADPSVPTAAGADLLARLGTGALVRIVAGTGEVRPLGGSAPAVPGSGPGRTDGSAPPTVAAGPVGPGVAPSWMTNLAVAGDGVWAVDPATGALSRFELAGGGPTASVDAPLDDVAAAPGALWTVSTNVLRSGYALDRRDPVTGAVEATVPVERGRLVAGPTDVWYADATLAGGRLWRVDPVTASLSSPLDAEIPLFGSVVVASADRVWWLDPSGRGLMAIDLATAQVTQVDLPSVPDAIAADASGVWTFHAQEAVARRVEGGRAVRTVDVPEGWSDLAVSADGAVWLVGRGFDAPETRVVRLDPAVTGG